METPMSMFPPSGAEIYRNDAGEPLGWDAPADPQDYYCDECGVCHAGPCPEPDDDDDDDDETDDDTESGPAAYTSWTVDSALWQTEHGAAGERTNSAWSYLEACYDDVTESGVIRAYTLGLALLRRLRDAQDAV
jgi:hypothetical protein